MRSLIRFISSLLILLSLNACDDAKNLLELALDPPDRRPIDVSRMGVNNFFVDSEFGSIASQYSEIRNTLGIKFVRVLFAWTDGVQPTPGSSLNYSFYDDILAGIPPGVDVLIVLSHTPSWMSNSANWIDGDPRKTWVESWLKPTVSRYKGTAGITGYEVWNEPDFVIVPSDAALGLTNPDLYFEMLVLASRAMRSIDPARFIVIASPRSLQQNFPNNLNYSKRLRDLGAEGFADIWNFHYYSKNYESLVTSNGVADFLNGIGLPIWCTESGATGPNRQLAYVEEVWPFLREKISGLDRIYYYEFGSPIMPVDNNFGMRTTDPAFPVSDLYIHLTGR